MTVELLLRNNISCTVAQRTDEAGIRIALGAASLAGRALSHVAASGQVNNLPPLLLGVLVISGAALIASVIPARRATRIQPLEALRYE